MYESSGEICKIFNKKKKIEKYKYFNSNFSADRGLSCAQCGC